MRRIARIFVFLAVLGLPAMPALANAGTHDKCPGACQGEVGFPYCQGDYVSTTGCTDGPNWCVSSDCTFLAAKADEVLASSTAEDSGRQLGAFHCQAVKSVEDSQEESGEAKSPEMKTRFRDIEVSLKVEVPART